MDSTTRPRKLIPDSLRSYNLHKVSQLDQDITTILMSIRKWRNSLVPINRLPEDVLSLVPTYLFHQSDRLRATFVCLHWRRTFLQRADLWSKLITWKGEEYTEAILGRSKETTLDVSIGGRVPADVDPLLSPHIRRIGCLDFVCNKWVDIQKFSEINTGPLPLLYTLDINVNVENGPEDFGVITPSLPLFSNAMHLKEFYFYSDTKRSPPINHFIFPSLVLFDFSVRPSEGFHVSPLLDFLEASPTLRTIHVRITANMSLEDVPLGRVVILPNVETFDLTVTDGGPGYKLAAHISCPSARHTTITQKDEDPEQAFPTSDLWDAIIRQYTRSSAEEVTLDLRTFLVFTCKLTFRSPDTTVIELNYTIDLYGENGDEYDQRTLEALEDVFTKATLVLRNHPQLAIVKCLNICHSFQPFLDTFPTTIPHIANETGRLFKALGSLDELTIYRCDIRPYFHSFLDVPEDDITEPVVFPPIKQLTISHPVDSSDGQCLRAIVGLAKSQHALGIPFERVIIYRENMPMGMEEGLRPWVGSVEHRDDMSHGQWGLPQLELVA